MKKKIFAWIMLLGFVLLLLNIIVFRYYWELSMVIYLFIIFSYILLARKQ